MGNVGNVNMGNSNYGHLAAVLADRLLCFAAEVQIFLPFCRLISEVAWSIITNLLQHVQW